MGSYFDRIEKKELEEVLAIAKKSGGDFSEVFLERKTNTGISMESDRIEKMTGGIDVGAGIRVIKGDRTIYAYTNEISFNALKNSAKSVANALGSKTHHDTINLTIPDAMVPLQGVLSPLDVQIEEKIEKIRMANSAAKKQSDRIKQVMVGYGDVAQEVWIVNSLGEWVKDIRIRTRLVVNAIAAQGTLMQTGYESMGSFSGFELFDEMDPAQLGEMAAERALKMLEASPAPSGKMPVILAAEAGGTMIHEACGHGLEADLVQKRLSVYAGKKNQRVAAENVTVIDDGSMKKYGHYKYDDEGVQSRKNVLIRNGILEEFMYDRLSAMKEDRESTGNGRRESYQSRPIPRMSNTYIASGEEDPARIIESTSRGLYVKKMGGGQVNTTNGDFVFDVAEGYLIENGKITKAVRGATLTGNGPEVLASIDRVGNDLGFAIGTCGKDGQGVPVADAQPTLRIAELIVGGTNSPPSGPTIRKVFTL